MQLNKSKQRSLHLQGNNPCSSCAGWEGAGEERTWGPDGCMMSRGQQKGLVATRQSLIRAVLPRVWPVLQIRKNVLTKKVVNSRSRFSREDVEHAS